MFKKFYYVLTVTDPVSSTGWW